jgi:nucleoside-diphosphate-sugar epimerase
MTRERPLVLVTGSSGLIGSRLLSKLGPRYRAVGLDVKPPVDGDQAATFIECDLTETESVNASLRQVRYQCGSRVWCISRRITTLPASRAPFMKS